MPELIDLNEDSTAKLSRRNVVVGTAWAVPAIMVVGAAPAMAASKIVSGVAGVSGSTITFTVVVSGYVAGDTVTIGTVKGTGTGSTMGWTTAPVASSTPDSTSGTQATFKIVGVTSESVKNFSWTAPFTVTKTGGGTALSSSIIFTY